MLICRSGLLRRSVCSTPTSIRWGRKWGVKGKTKKSVQRLKRYVNGVSFHTDSAGEIGRSSWRIEGEGDEGNWIGWLRRCGFSVWSSEERWVSWRQSANKSNGRNRCKRATLFGELLTIEKLGCLFWKWWYFWTLDEILQNSFILQSAKLTQNKYYTEIGGMFWMTSGPVC